MDEETNVLRPLGFSSNSVKPEQRSYGPGEQECFAWSRQQENGNHTAVQPMSFTASRIMSHLNGSEGKKTNTENMLGGLLS